MKKVNLIALTVWLFCIFAAFLYFQNNVTMYRKELNEIIARTINGYIIRTKDAKRGFQYVDIIDGKDTLAYFFPAAYTFEKYNIQPLDSVSKKANSAILMFYKPQNGVYEKCCDYEIEY